jgi:serine/threonine protein kinase
VNADARVLRHHALAAALAQLDDETFAAAEHLGTGIGGSTSRLMVGGTPVFVKRIALTDLERAHPRQTGNLFGLPSFYQYGIGSAGFGVWRELAAHQRATDWVLTGQCASFPLLHHWRVVPRAAEPKPIDETVEYWDGDPAVRRRLTALGDATSSVLLALEFVPDSLSDRLCARPEQAHGRVAELYLAAIAFMSSQGMVHFDAHPGNVLADDQQVYVTDFGLATDAGFDLAPDESRFLTRHLDFDRQSAERYLGRWAPDRYAEAARKMDGFFDRLVRGPKASVEWTG